MKVFGQLEKAQIENTTADVAVMPKGMVTYRTDINQVKVSNGTIYKILTDEDSVQTLLNKTLVTPRLNIIQATEQGVTPATPATGTRLLYAKNDGVYQLNSLGVETQVGGGVADGSVTRAKLAPVGQVQSAVISQSFFTLGTTDVTNSFITLTTTGRPVIIALISNGASSIFLHYRSGASSNVRTFLVRGATIIYDVNSTVTSAGATSCQGTAHLPYHIDTPPAGTHTYKMQVQFGGAGQGVDLYFFRLVAFEL